MKIGSRLKQKHQLGFTLIELIAVMAIIALIASLLFVSISQSRIKARNGRRLADINILSKAMDLYYANCNSFPQTPAGVSGFRLDTTKSLYLGTRPSCGNHQGTLLAGQSNGGIGSATPSGTILVQQFTPAPLPADDGSLAAGSRCSEANTQLANSTWNDFIYYPDTNSANKYGIYFCIGAKTGDFVAGRYALTERGILRIVGANYSP